MEYRRGSHTKFKIEYHFVWVTKYRYHMLEGDLALRVRELVRQTCEYFEIQEYLEHHFEKDPNDKFDIE